jgi:hypothetical protein
MMFFRPSGAASPEITSNILLPVVGTIAMAPTVTPGLPSDVALSKPRAEEPIEEVRRATGVPFPYCTEVVKGSGPHIPTGIERYVREYVLIASRATV